ncbi:hypothetical protein F66182_8498 [Fusarium sp. NRRL 66182]|nr:hypothetical protein F66182_8498 [Fusarium sp. NRRL 66182]
MEIAGLALGAVSAAPVLAQYGYRIYQRVENRRKLEPLTQELAIFGVEERQNQLAVLITLAQSVLKSRMIDEQHKNRLRRTWDRIKRELIRVQQLMDEMASSQSIWESLQRREARNELLEIGNSGILTRLRNEFRDEVMMLREYLNGPSSHYLPSSDFTILESIGESSTGLVRGRTPASRDVAWFLMESKPYESGTKNEVKESIDILSQKLSQAQPDSGILPFLGYRDDARHNHGSFQLIFRGPFDGRLPLTLSEFIVNHPFKPSLNFRVDLCYQLATSVLQTQMLGLVHKNIRPENILIHPPGVLQSPTAKPGEDIPALSLVGWQYAREAERGVTTFVNPVNIQTRIYQHPERQVPTAEREYSMAHDVYSLGACMLEIIRWESVLQSDGVCEHVSVSEAFTSAFRKLGFQPDEAMDPYTRFPSQNKKVLVSMSETYIPSEAGTKMSHIVQGFLTCLDNRGREMDDGVNRYVLNDETDRVRVAMNFVDTALKDLRNIQASI